MSCFHEVFELGDKAIKQLSCKAFSLKSYAKLEKNAIFPE